MRWLEQWPFQRRPRLLFFTKVDRPHRQPMQSLPGLPLGAQTTQARDHLVTRRWGAMTCKFIVDIAGWVRRNWHRLFDGRNKKSIAVNPSKKSVIWASYCRTEVMVVATNPLHQELMRVKYQLNTGTLLLHTANGCGRV